MIHNVKLAWIAFFALWVYWGLIWFLRHAFGDEEQQESTTRQEGDAEATAAGAGATGAGIRGWLGRRRVRRAHSRLSRASDVLRDLVLMLLSVLLLNTLGRGSTRTVMILAWVFFAFAVIWSIFEAAYESRIARFIYGAIFYGIALSIAALAFKHGFHEFH
ncbi:hypothetical protein K492DRAFT_130010 [Lichtheimia hyalospora FSU 10163]|nr:hypothetical protein K492DRAFT_130010 [Lichtheimia hyalospora FSU 10163]